MLCAFYKTEHEDDDAKEKMIIDCDPGHDDAASDYSGGPFPGIGTDWYYVCSG